MQYRFRIDAAHRLALAEISGPVDGPMCLAAIVALHADPAWDPAYDVIWDGRGITELVLGTEDVKRNVEAKSVDSYGRDLIVVSRDIDYLAARLEAHLARTRGKEMRVFRSLDDALAVLGMDELPPALKQWLDEADAA